MYLINIGNAERNVLNGRIIATLQVKAVGTNFCIITSRIFKKTM
jgi:hypothetical protein